VSEGNPLQPIAAIVPTRNRPDSFQRLAESVQDHAPGTSLHAIRTPTDDYDHPHATMWESPDWPIATLYRAVAAQIEPEAYLFLDDDHSIQSDYEAASLIDAVRRYPAWVLLIRTDRPATVVRDAAKCGGQLVDSDTYWQAGGHGTDYLDDIELSLRLAWQENPPRRYPDKITTHHQGLSGGLQDHPRVPDKATGHETLSQLATTYDRVEPDPHAYHGIQERPSSSEAEP
jgi:hypothetical protein